VVDLSDKNPRQITIQDSNARNPTWTSDGKSILFDSNMLGNTSIFKINPKNERIIHQLIDRGASDSAPGIAPDGTIIAFGTTSKTAESLWIADIDSKNLNKSALEISQNGHPVEKNSVFVQS